MSLRQYYSLNSCKKKCPPKEQMIHAGIADEIKDGNIRFDRELDHIGKKIICPSINDQTRAIKWRPTFMISKHCMFA